MLCNIFVSFESGFFCFVLTAEVKPALPPKAAGELQHPVRVQPHLRVAGEGVREDPRRMADHVEPD